MLEADEDYSLVNVQNYFESIRSSGYDSTSNALAELIDNSIQARATKVSIRLFPDQPTNDGRRKPRVLLLAIHDNGTGMDRRKLREGLRIGGSERFGDRSGLGRFGMGLKNASFSQCKRLQVITWPNELAPAISSHLDIEDIRKGEQKSVPVPYPIAESELPQRMTRQWPTGTLVLWSKCDELDRNGIAETLANDIRQDLARIFRKYLIRGSLKISVDGTEIEAFDPLFVEGSFAGSKKYEIQVNVSHPSCTGRVVARVSVFPEEWQKDEQSLNPELREAIEWRHKHALGFSILRNDREIDCGLFRLRKPHHSDRWWAGEICFNAELDEAFGISNTKQNLAIDSDVVDQLKRGIQPIMSKALSEIDSRRGEHRTQQHARRTEVIAKELEAVLGPTEWINIKSPGVCDTEIREFTDRNSNIPNICDRLRNAHFQNSPFIIEFENASGASFFRYHVVGRVIVLLINRAHPFFYRLYEPLAKAEGANGVGCELLLVSFLKAFLSSENSDAQLSYFTRTWGDCLAKYLSADLL